MKRQVTVLIIAGLFIIGFLTLACTDDVIWRDIGGESQNVKSVLVSSEDAQTIYAGTDNGVLKTIDGGKSWRYILSFGAGKTPVNSLKSDANDNKSVFAATAKGLYLSRNLGKTWSRIFKGKGSLESDCTTLAALDHTWFLGTKGGLFISRDKGHSWHKEKGRLGNSHILSIACDGKKPGAIYIACRDGVFKAGDKGDDWMRIFTAYPTEDGSDVEGEEIDQDAEEQFSEMRYVAVDPRENSSIYLATARGVYKSRDRGSSWDALTSHGLLDREVKFLMVTQSSVPIAVTKPGIFSYNEGFWRELSLRLASGEIASLEIDNHGGLYAATERGLFKADKTDIDIVGTSGHFSLPCQAEPEISEVLEAAIRYAEVEPEKIESWRKLAARAAWMPEVSVGIDRDASDLWHWETGSTTKADDDTLIRGRDTVEWDVTLSWDLSKLIWNDDQTSIDVRSRLLVQLRDDILDEVTKLYFERIRVKYDLDNLTLEDRRKRFEKELKIRELTASLDALTGGFFSRRTYQR